MSGNIPPLLVASFGNAMAGDDAFGPIVCERVRSLRIRGVDVVDIGMQPYGLLHHLEGREGLVIVDASQATNEAPAGKLLYVDFFNAQDIQLVHDIALSTHGLSVADELELARRLDLLPSKVKLVTLTGDCFEVGKRPSRRMLLQIESAASLILETASQWQREIGALSHA